MKILLSLLAFFYFVPTFSQTESLKDVASLIIDEFYEQNYEEAALNALDYLIQRTKKDNTKEFNFYNEKGYINWTLHQYIPSKRHAFRIMNNARPDKNYVDIEIKEAQNDLEAVIFWCGALSFLKIADNQYNDKDIESPIIHFKTKTKYHRDDVLISNSYMAYIFADICGCYTDRKAHLGELKEKDGQDTTKSIITLNYFGLTNDCLAIKSLVEDQFNLLSTARPFAYYLSVKDTYQESGFYGPADKYMKDLEKRRKKFQKKHSLPDIDNNHRNIFYKNIFE